MLFLVVERADQFWPLALLLRPAPAAPASWKGRSSGEIRKGEAYAHPVYVDVELTLPPPAAPHALRLSSCFPIWRRRRALRR